MFRAGLALTLIATACSAPRIGDEIEPASGNCSAGSPGIDVSGYQPNTDWQMASTMGGLEWAIIKATEGVTYTNPYFAQDWAGTKANGMVRGAYCFFHPSPDDPVQEADFFVSTVQAQGLERGDILALDLETLDMATADQTAADALAWLEEVKKQTGITPIIYTSPRVYDTLLMSPAGYGMYPLWDVTWCTPTGCCPNLPSAWSDWKFWQYAGDSLTFPGVYGKNDGDLFHGTKDELATYAASLWPPVAAPDAGVTGAPDAGMVTVAPDAGGAQDVNGTVTGGCAIGGKTTGGGWLLVVVGIGLSIVRRRRTRRSSDRPRA